MNFKLYLVLTSLVNVILFYSIFDLYFVSPIVQVSKDHSPLVEPPASRLVLFVADGLRADKFFSLTDHLQTRSPFLRNVILKHGTWGVSRTRAPTESRPCHVAMTSGFYEDVTAIYKGWKENMVDFDNIFNKSKSSWAFGSYEVLPIFAKGTTTAHYHSYLYPGNSDDNWVMNKFSSFLDNVKNGSHLHDALHQQQIIFFFHLVATDTFGHRFGSVSSAYANNIAKVDNIVKRVVGLLDRFYANDRRTAYVFVSDHGMTDTGAHGGGSHPEVESPLVVWGSGASKHESYSSSLDQFEETRTKSWGLDPRHRHDVEQADLAALMSSLLGLPVPSNSMGMLPLQYLSVGADVKAKLMLSNAEQSCELFKAKLQIAKSSSLLFFPFYKLRLDVVSTRLQQVSNLIEREKFSDALIQSAKLIRLAQEGIRYYHAYHRYSLFIVLIFSFVGWIIVGASFLAPSSQIYVNRVPTEKYRVDKKLCFYILAVCLTIFLLSFAHSSITDYFYYFLPLFIWLYIIEQQLIAKVFSMHDNRHLLIYIFVVLGIGMIAVSFFCRPVLSLILIFILVLGLSAHDISCKTKCLWAAAIFVAMIFPFIPPVAQVHTNFFLILAAGIASFVSYVLNFSKKYAAICLLPLLSVALLYLFHNGRPNAFSLFLPAIGWLILLLSWLLPFLVPPHPPARMWCLFTVHCASYLLLSVSYDALFFVTFLILLLVWVKYESELGGLSLDHTSDFKHVSLEDHGQLSRHVVRISFVFVFFLFFALFGVQTTASISHFNTSRFASIFSPATSGLYLKNFLFGYKISLPYLLITCSLISIVMTNNISLKLVLCFSVVMSEMMGLIFLFMVRDEGSWLEIGTSISHYAISMSLVMSFLVLFPLSKRMLSCNCFYLTK